MPSRSFRFFARLLVICCVLSATSVSAVERRYDFQRKHLKNGLTVISLEDHTCPIVAVQVWYHVGSKDENPERQGFAHMFEHMMFRGTDKLGPEEHFSCIRRTGGDCNAYTTFDNTTYINELPSNQLELALWLEAERMAFLKIDDESFFKERAVVEEERRLRTMNAPYGMVTERLLSGLFHKHPYRWSPIGQIPHLRAATIDELQAFWDKYYVPVNAVLVVVGDVRHEQVLSLAEKCFGWIPGGTVPPRIEIKEPAQAKAQTLTIPEKKGPVPIIGYVYHGVPQGDPDELPLEMLMDIVGNGESSRAYKEIVKDKKLAQIAIAVSISLEDSGLFGGGAVLLPGTNQKKVFKCLAEQLDRVTKEPVLDRELQKVKNKMLRNEVTQSLTVASKATLLGRYETLEHDAEKANTRLERIRAVTTGDLLRVARKYLAKSNRTTVKVEPQYGSVVGKMLGISKEEDVDEGAAPPKKPVVNRVAKRGEPRTNLKRPPGFSESPPAAAVLESFPDVPREESRLDNGLRVVVVPNHEVPFVTFMLGIPYGSWTDAKPGTASMAANLITKGSEHHTAAELAEELEFNAISLDGDSSMDAASVNASCVADKMDLTCKLMAEAVRTPKFPQDEFDILRKQISVGLMVSTRTPEYLADRELRQRLFGNHPYSRTTTGEMRDVESITRSDVSGWWTHYVRPDACVLYVAGDVQSKDVIESARRYFGDWKASGTKPNTALAATPAAGKTQIYLVDRPASVQSQIRIGHLGVTRTSPAYFTTRVLSQIFGGAFDSRLNHAVRVERGLTYGARGGFSAQRFAGTFTISTFTKTPSTAETVRVLMQEVDRLRSSPPEEKEMSAARSYLVGSFAGERETPQAIVSDLWLMESAGLPKDYFQQYLDHVKKTTADDVQKASERLVHRDALTVVVVGEAKSIKSDLAKIAPVTVVEPSDKIEEPPGKQKDGAESDDKQD